MGMSGKLDVKIVKIYSQLKKYFLPFKMRLMHKGYIAR